MKTYKRGKVEYTFSGAMTCGLCAAPLILKERKKRNSMQMSGSVYYQVIGCPEPTCVVNGTGRTKMNQFIAYWPKHMADAMVHGLKTRLSKNHILDVSTWTKKGYSIEEAKNKIQEHQKRASRISLSGENRHRCVITKQRLVELGYTEEQAIGLRSLPIQKEYWMYRHSMTEEEAMKCVSDHQKKMSSRVDHTRLDAWPNQIGYWLKKGLSKDEAKSKVSDAQIKFSLDLCIKKHGLEKGSEIWLKRQKKWHDSYKKSNFSQVSQLFFWELYELLSDDFKKENDVYFATLDQTTMNKDTTGENHEYRLMLNSSFIRPDFFVLQKRKIVEFDGVYYHRGIPENALRDALRDVNIVNSGYEVLHIDEMNAKNNKHEALASCIKFLNA